jgi:hypothetical protein
MALLEKQYETDYVDYLASGLNLTSEQRTIMNLYTLLYGIDFLTVHGHSFNKSKPIEIEEKEILHLKNVVAKYLGLI